jgi:hypothetical protein
MPEAPDPEACFEAQLHGGMWPHFSQHCEYRIAHSPAAFSGAERAEMLCWIRMRDMPLDAGGLLFLFWRSADRCDGFSLKRDECP